MPTAAAFGMKMFLIFSLFLYYALTSPLRNRQLDHVHAQREFYAAALKLHLRRPTAAAATTSSKRRLSKVKTHARTHARHFPKRKTTTKIAHLKTRAEISGRGVEFGCTPRGWS